MILVLENSLNIKHRQCFYKEIKQKSKLILKNSIKLDL